MSVLMPNDTARAGGAAARADWWAREKNLVDRLRLLRDRTGAAAGPDDLPDMHWDVPWRAAEVISDLTRLCLGVLHRTRSSEVAEAHRLCEVILDLQQLAMDWFLHDTAMRSQRLADCASGLSRLRGVSSSAALIDSACTELITRCGFQRAVLSRVDGGGWKPLMLRNREKATGGSWFADWVNQTVPLTAATPEAEMMSRRRPSLVYDTANAPVYRPLIVAAGQSRSYVVAPLVLGEDVIGFLHTDHHPLPRRVDVADRDVLWAFADGFSHIHERAVLMERLCSHRESVRELFFGAVERIDDLCGSVQQNESTDTDQPWSGPASPVDLTERETDVLQLMITGATNQEIADSLVITEGTVKSHVKHILRKYGAINRAQAIAWALQEC